MTPRILRLSAIALACLPLWAASRVDARAATPETIFSFSGKDGQGLVGNLVRDENGAIYGTASSSDSGFGLVYQLSPPERAGGQWRQDVIHRFDNPIKGARPFAGLTYQRSTGQFYGTTAIGGLLGRGTVFRLTPPATAGQKWKHEVLSNLGSGVSEPRSQLALSKNGKIYGATLGQFGRCAEVFELSPKDPPGGEWPLKVIYKFNSDSDGCINNSQIIIDGDKRLYGVILSGAKGHGYVYMLDPPETTQGAWEKSNIYEFKGKSDGEAPVNQGLAIGASGKIYGTSHLNSRSILYELAPPANIFAKWSFRIVSRFPTDTFGFVALTKDNFGRFYGTNINIITNRQTIYRIDRLPSGDWSLKTLARMTFEEGRIDNKPLLAVGKDLLYGVSDTVDGSCGCADVFKLQVSQPAP